MLGEYYRWILTDIATLLAIELVFAGACFQWPRKGVTRLATVTAAVVCTYAVMNAGWIIRTGTQILPSVLLPLFNSPVNTLVIIGANLLKMPVEAITLLAPSAIALGFFFWVLAKSPAPGYSPRHFKAKMLLSLSLILAALTVRVILPQRLSADVVSQQLRYNCHAKAVMSLFAPGTLKRADFEEAKRVIPAFDELIVPKAQGRSLTNHNIVIVVLEGVQYACTSFGDKGETPSPQDKGRDLTPFLAQLAEEGVCFSRMRSTLTHTTKALFSLLTGRYPSVSHDIFEAVPARKPYASLATILERQMNFRTAFFQSAKGTFECRPGLVTTLGFERFGAREDVCDPNAFLGSLGCDEFELLEPITDWISSDSRPFLLAIMCSATHDPYDIPDWYGGRASKDLVELYRDTIAYTDTFLRELDATLTRLGLRENTMLCIVGDHGEAFGEHGFNGHERITFEETLRVPWVLRAPSLIEGGTRIDAPVSSIDVTPTLLALLGFDVESAGFDGVNALGEVPLERRIYFSGWLNDGPAGYIEDNIKYMHSPADRLVSIYDLNADPLEQNVIEPNQTQAKAIVEEIFAWRKETLLPLNQDPAGEKILFDRWLCSWNNRISHAKYLPHDN